MYTIEEFDEKKSKILKYIMYKKRSKQEIKNKFAGTMPEELLEDIIAELEENGYIDDSSYVERAINEFIALNNLSIKEVKYKLYNKGISSNIIDDYMSKNYEKMKEYEITSALNIIGKKINTLEENEIIQYLLKKGYKTDNIREAIDKMDY